MSSPHISDIVDYFSDEFKASQGDVYDEENSTLESMSDDDPDDTEGSLKDFVVGSDEDEDSFKEIVPVKNISVLAKEGLDEKNILTGSRRRKPAERYQPEDSAIYQVLMLGDVDLNYYNETEEKDLQKIEEQPEETDLYEPDEDDEDESMDDISLEEDDNEYYDEGDEQDDDEDDEYEEEEEEEEDEEDDKNDEEEEDVQQVTMVSKVLPAPKKSSDQKKTFPKK